MQKCTLHYLPHEVITPSRNVLKISTDNSDTTGETATPVTDGRNNDMVQLSSFD